MRVPGPQEKYLDDVFGAHSSELDEVRTRLTAAGKVGIAVSASEARMLQFFVRSICARRVVEFGTLYGYSTLAVAEALPSDGLIYTLERDPEHHTAAAATFRASPYGAKIKSLCGEAAQLMLSLSNEGPFDLIFIDADKGGYVDYLNWAEANLRVGGLIIGDNTFLWGGVWDEPARESIGNKQIQVMKEFNARLADPSRYDSILIPTLEGMTVARRLQ